MLQIGRNIKLIRGLAGLKQVDFALLISENLSNLKTYETKDVMPKPHIQQRIAKIGGVTVEDLIEKKLTIDDIKINLEVEKVKKGGREVFLSHSSPDLDYREKYIESLERENKRLQKDLGISLGELRHRALLALAIAETNQQLLIELLAKQRKVEQQTLAVEVGKENGVKYQKIKATGIHSYEDS